MAWEHPTSSRASRGSRARTHCTLYCMEMPECREGQTGEKQSMSNDPGTAGAARWNRIRFGRCILYCTRGWRASLQLYAEHPRSAHTSHTHTRTSQLYRQARWVHGSWTQRRKRGPCLV